MKVSVATISDFDYEVVDVVIRLEHEHTITNCWARGYSDSEWEQAEIFARELAIVLGCEYVGEIAE